ncbi:MAG: hypothetical protein HC848_04120 [Limnobacter sp.]|nr:hypothetical protein [Limnobacter sp.]
MCSQYAANNQAKGLSGFLVTDGEDFMQVLHGPYEKVVELFVVLQHDPAHYDLRLVQVKHKAFASLKEYGMRGVFVGHNETTSDDILGLALGLGEMSLTKDTQTILGMLEHKAVA